MDIQTTSPIYLDWSFWAVVIAFVALVLSQLPPLHRLLRKANVDFELYSRISLTHKAGNPNLQIHIIVSNNGGKRVRVKSMSATLIRDGREVCSLPAENFLDQPNDTSTVLFTSFSLAPEEEWRHIVNFLNFFDRDNNKGHTLLITQH